MNNSNKKVRSRECDPVILEEFDVPVIESTEESNSLAYLNEALVHAKEVI